MIYYFAREKTHKILIHVCIEIRNLTQTSYFLILLIKSKGYHEMANSLKIVTPF